MNSHRRPDWAEWGVDYLKTHYCGYLQIERDSEERRSRNPCVVMRRALDQIDRGYQLLRGLRAPTWRTGAPSPRQPVAYDPRHHR